MSLSTSVENVPPSQENQTIVDGGNMCLELALEGERLCKSGDCRAGVAFFQAAIQAGTDDLRTLSAIYSQLGNAYFYLGDYAKAMQYHKHDLTLARTMGDLLGEAKSSGNLGNTLKVMGKFDEAMICCKRHLEISRQLKDKLSEGRALYNLGNVYHAKGKHIGRVGQQDPGEFPEEVKSCLLQAVKYYEENLTLMRELGDTAAQGRACGNLGNTYYLLGDFQQAIKYHQDRLKIAREFGDKAAERRAHSNLGNSHIFLGEFEAAAEHYKRTLALAQELGDRAVEAQSCYSLGNTYTLLRDYASAIEHHMRHLVIAQQLEDRVGEGRACWSLGNAHAAIGNHEKALYFATKHLEISKQLGDTTGQQTAEMNVADLRKVLGLDTDDWGKRCEAASANVGGASGTAAVLLSSSSSNSHRPPRVRRLSMEHIRLMKLTPDTKSKTMDGISSSKSNQDDKEMFFDILSRFQSERMDDQRCSINVKSSGKENREAWRDKKSSSVPSNQSQSGLNTVNSLNKKPTSSGDSSATTAAADDLLDLIAGMQSKRMDEQRMELPHLPGLVPPNKKPNASPGDDEEFLDLLMRSQSSRLEDQRSSLPEENAEESVSSVPRKAPTVPDEDFFTLISRMQSGRMDDQRAVIPSLAHNANRISSNSRDTNNGVIPGKKEKKK